MMQSFAQLRIIRLINDEIYEMARRYGRLGWQGMRKEPPSQKQEDAQADKEAKTPDGLGE